MTAFQRAVKRGIPINTPNLARVAGREDIRYKAKVLFLFLSRRQGRGTSMRSLGLRAGVGERQASRYISELREVRLLQVRKGGDGQPNKYAVKTQNISDKTSKQKGKKGSPTPPPKKAKSLYNIHTQSKKPELPYVACGFVAWEDVVYDNRAELLFEAYCNHQIFKPSERLTFFSLLEVAKQKRQPHLYFRKIATHPEWWPRLIRLRHEEWAQQRLDGIADRKRGEMDAGIESALEEIGSALDARKDYRKRQRSYDEEE